MEQDPKSPSQPQPRKLQTIAIMRTPPDQGQHVAPASDPSPAATKPDVPPAASAKPTPPAPATPDAPTTSSTKDDAGHEHGTDGGSRLKLKTRLKGPSVPAGSSAEIRKIAPPTTPTIMGTTVTPEKTEKQKAEISSKTTVITTVPDNKTPPVGGPVGSKPDRPDASAAAPTAPAPAPASPAPVKPADHDSSVKPKLQARHTPTPTHLETPPDEHAGGGKKDRKRKIQKAEDSGDRAKTAAAIVALILATAGNSLTLLPTWLNWFKDGKVPQSELVVLAILTALLALLILTKGIISKLLGSVTVLLLMICCIAAIVIPPFLWNYAKDVITLDELSKLPPPGILAGSSLLFLSAFIMITGSSAVQWTLAAVIVLLSAVMPFIPFADLLPNLPNAPVVEKVGDVVITLPGAWTMLPVEPDSPTEEGGQKRTFRSPDGGLAVTVAYRQMGPEMSLADYGRQLLNEYRQEYPASGTFMSDIPGKPNQRKISVLSNLRIDVMIVQKNDSFYTVTVSGDGAAFTSNDAQIKQIFARFD